MKLRWLLPGFLGVFLLSYPAEAAKLQFWRFDADQRRLTFTTDGGVQPRAQMITNPTRLIIDLPGIDLDRPKVNQIVGQTIRAIRIAQFDRQVTRLVVELAPGYTLDPQQIRVRGETPTQWSVQLPNPQPLPQATSPQPAPAQTASPLPSSNSRAARQTVRAATNAGTQVDNIRVTPDGFFVQTRGNLPQVDVDRSRDKKQIHVDLKGAALASGFTQQSFSLNLLGVSQLQVAQTQLSPPIARVTLNVDKESPDWQATVSNLGGVVLLPRGGASKLPGERPASSYYLLTQPQISPRTTRSNQVPSSRFAQAPVPRTTDVPVPLPPISNPIAPPDPSPQPFPQPRRSNPDERVVVVVDIGHGGKDSGAIGIGGLREKDVILPIGLKIAEILQDEDEDIEVVLPRSDDRFIDLAPRVALAKQANADIFVSIHANAINMSRQDISGIETYYYSPGGARLARVIHNSILEKVGPRDRGVRKANFYVIKRSPMPAVLVEVGFVTGAEDAPKLRDSDYQEEMAEAIARGILQYLQIGSD